MHSNHKNQVIVQCCEVSHYYHYSKDNEVKVGANE